MHEDHSIRGIHHITLVTGDAERNARFYVNTLGLGFVKKTVNFDRPDTYHLYFGDQTGTPGTLVTFFEWPHAPRGRIGVGATHHFAMTVESSEAQLKWKRRLTDAGLRVNGPFNRGAFMSIYFTDPDGVILEIATRGPGWDAIRNDEEVYIPPADRQIGGRDDAAIAAQTWPEPVPTITPDMRLAGLHHISAMASAIERTDAFYREVLEMDLLRKSVNYDDPSMPHWYWGVGAGEPGTIMTYFGMPPRQGVRPVHGQIGRGLTHHIAFEVPGDDAILAWREHLLNRGLSVTEVLDRKYFHSIYFNDPDGHILEIATAGPGFLVDQPVERLGRDLALPDWLEIDRQRIEAGITPIDLGEVAGVTGD
jgi:glyoxalase family protein